MKNSASNLIFQFTNSLMEYVLFRSVKVGSQILIADGSLVCEVREILEVTY